jgi:hypothetical protein
MAPARHGNKRKKERSMKVTYTRLHISVSFQHRNDFIYGSLTTTTLEQGYG